MSGNAPIASTRSIERMNSVLQRQKAAYICDGAPGLDLRQDRLARCIQLLISHEKRIVAALADDFGSRPAEASAMADVVASVNSLKHARRHVKSWMRPEKRKTSPTALAWFGARAEVQYQPKGTVGIISPWNFPVNLTFAPLAGVLASGNRAMIKPSELTPATSALFADLIASSFDELEIAVFTGDEAIGAAFSELPLDHLVFTGATTIGRHVMRAAAKNLVPVTLELGGKSPVVLGRSADLVTAAARIMAGKMLNAGQVCLAPDYVLVPHEQLEDFAREAALAVTAMFPTLVNNPDYTAIISQRHYDRLKAYVDDARVKGAQIIEINPTKENLNQLDNRKIAPTLILNATDDMNIMQEEIFGPLLPIVSYNTIDEAISYINARDRPLGIYFFGHDANEEHALLTATVSGGVTINDVIFHISMEDLPFGGIGASGMGSYHGVDGFREFSHRRAVYRQVRRELRALKLLRPPYGAALRRFISRQLKP